MPWYCQPPAYHMSTDGNQPFPRDWAPHLRSGEPSGGYFQFAELDFLPLHFLIYFCSYQAISPSFTMNSCFWCYPRKVYGKVGGDRVWNVAEPESTCQHWPRCGFHTLWPSGSPKISSRGHWPRWISDIRGTRGLHDKADPKYSISIFLAEFCFKYFCCS